MSAKPDYYDVLGVERTASKDDIRKAYRGLARRYHPDVSREPDAEAKFRQINEAYEVLRDPDKRGQYDRFGHAGPGAPFGAGFDDFGGIGDVFDAFFGGGRRARPGGVQPGADVRVRAELDFLDSIFGVETSVVYKRLEPCGTCGGNGAAPGTRPTTCPACRGAGQVQRAQRSIFGQFVNVTLCDTCGGRGQTIQDKCAACTSIGLERVDVERRIKIPAGIPADTELRLTGEGDHGPRGGAPGDLYIGVDVTPHPVLERKGDDIASTVVVNVAEAALGAEVEIETVDGPSTVKIAAGTQAGAAVRLRGKGAPRLRGSGRGDHLLHVHVATPSKLSRAQRRLLEELRETLPAGGDRDGRSFVDKVRAAFR